MQKMLVPVHEYKALQRLYLEVLGMNSAVDPKAARWYLLKAVTVAEGIANQGEVVCE